MTYLDHVHMQGKLIAGMVLEDGNMCIWPIANNTVGEITMERVPGPVTAISASAMESSVVILIGTARGVHAARTSDGCSATIVKLGQVQKPAQVSHHSTSVNSRVRA